jgi:hypothetical protein
MRGLVGQIVIFFAVGALQVGGAETPDTLYRARIANQRNHDFIVIVKRTYTLMGGVVGLVAIVARVDTGVIVEERLIPARIVTLGANIQISAFQASHVAG